MSVQTSGRRKAGIAVVGALLGCTLVAGALVGQSTAAKALQPQAAAALQQAGITGVDVTFKGREAYLNGDGKSPAELDQAKQVVESVNGVRWAKISGTNVNPSPSSVNSSSISLSPERTIAVTTTPGQAQTVTVTPTSDSEQTIPVTVSPSTTPTSSETGTITILTDADKAKINSTVLQFGNGSYALSAKARLQLDTIIPLLKNDPTAKLRIDGFVSLPHPAGKAVGDSKRRAQAVADYLTAHGIKASQLIVRGRGGTDPAASNSTTAGQSANRRVTLTIV